MKFGKSILALAVIAGSTLASSAMANFLLPTGDVKFKLTDAANVYRDSDSGLTPVGRGNLDPTSPTYLAGIPLAGDEDFTAFRITSYNVNGGDDSSDFGGQTLVGVVTFLKVASVDGPIAFGGNTLVNVNIDGSVRSYDAGPAGTIGRFFLFATDDPNAGDFTAITNASVDFSTGLADNLVSDGTNSYTIDHLLGFTTGAGTYKLVLTGGMLPDGDGDIDDSLSTSGVGASNPEQSFFGSIATHDMIADGGTWFNAGVVVNPANFQINQVVYSDQGSYNGRGDQGVYDGGWQISSEDPVHVFTQPAIPEPVTAGLGVLTLAGLAGYATRRRA